MWNVAFNNVTKTRQKEITITFSHWSTDYMMRLAFFSCVHLNCNISSITRGGLENTKQLNSTAWNSSEWDLSWINVKYNIYSTHNSGKCVKMKRKLTALFTDIRRTARSDRGKRKYWYLVKMSHLQCTMVGMHDNRFCMSFFFLLLLKRLYQVWLDNTFFQPIELHEKY